MNSFTSRAIDRAMPLAPVVFLAVIAILTIVSVSPRPKASRGPAAFSSERAMLHVRALAARPRPAGSAGHRAAREYIVATLRATAGLEVEIRSTSATSTRYGLPYDAARVHNIVATIPGTDASRRIVLLAHYDTVLTTPGAGDDAAGVATLLEAARALAVDYGGGPDVMLLFTDAEEVGALGAEAFLASDGFDPKRMTVLNFDSRGTGGACALIETAGGEGSLVRAIAGSKAPVAMSSLLPALARLHGVGTDFRPFREAGASGLNFALVEGVARYHTPADTADALDRESVGSQGEAAVALVRELGNAARASRSGPVSYFTVPLAGLVVYRRLLDVAAAILATVLVVFGLIISMRRKESSWRALGASALVTIAAVALAGGASHFAWRLVRIMGGGPAAGLAEPYDPVPYRFALVLLAVGTALGVARIARRLGVAQPTTLVPLFALAVLWALVRRLPGASYLLALPILFIALHALLRSREKSLRVRALGVAIAALPIVLVWAPVPYFVLSGLRLSAAGMAGALAAFAALLCAAVFERARFAVDGRLAAALIALAVVAAGIGATGTSASPRTPRPASFAYAVDVDAGKAFWVSERRTAGQPENTLFAEAVRLETLPRFLSEEGTLRRAAVATYVAVPGPSVALVSDVTDGALRVLTVRVRSERAAPWVHLFVEKGKVVDASVNGMPFKKSAGDGNGGAMWGFRYLGAGDESLELKLVVDPRGGQPRITVVDQSGGIDAVGGQLPLDAMYARSWVAGTTLVRRSYVF